MKRKKIFLLYVVLVSVFMSSSCQQERVTETYFQTNPEDEGFTIYLANSEMNGLIPIAIQLKENKMEEQIDKILQALREDSLENAKALLPATVQVQKIRIQDNNVMVTFNQGYKTMSPVEELLVRSAIVKSVTELDEIDTVEFYIEGAPLKTTTGLVIGPMGKDDIIISSGDHLEEKKITKNVTLYFSDLNGTSLVPVQYELTLTEDEQLEKKIINLLIEGPKEQGLISVIPKETKIRNIYVNENICYINLSKEFVSKHIGGSIGEQLTIYSIVNSLTELPNINKVQFLIEGELVQEFKGHVTFNVLFERNLDIVKK